MKTATLKKLKNLQATNPNAFVTYGDADLGMPIDIDSAMIKKAFKKAYPKAISGNWNFFICNEKPRNELSLKVGETWLACTFQAGQGADFIIKI